MSIPPPGWVPVPIGDLCDLYNGRAFKPSEWGTRGLPIIRIQNLNNPRATFNFFEGETNDRHIVSTGDLLFAWSGTPGTSFGAHIWQGPKAILNQHIFKVVFDTEHLDTTFFKHAINQKLTELIGKAQGGVGLRHITKGKFEETEVTIPPINEQRRISAKLEQSLDRTRRARDGLTTAVPLLKAYKNSVLERAFGSNDPANATTYEATPLSALVDEGPANGWSPKTGPDATGALALKLTATTSGYLRLDDQAVKRIYERPPASSKYWLMPGDLLIQRANALEHLGAAAIYEGPLRTYIYPDLMMRVRVKDEEARRYLWRYINSPTGRRYLQDHATGTAGNMPKFNARTLVNMPIPVPRNRDFASVNRALDLTFSFVEEIEKEIRSAVSLVEILDRAVLRRAFMGALVPQDAADEPAMVLLEKIRAGRLFFRKTSHVVGDRTRPGIAPRQKGQASVAKKRPEVNRNHLQRALREMGGSAPAKDLWKGSQMDIEEFYKQLRDELSLGHVRQGTGEGDTVMFYAA